MFADKASSVVRGDEEKERNLTPCPRTRSRKRNVVAEGSREPRESRVGERKRKRYEKGREIEREGIGSVWLYRITLRTPRGKENRVVRGVANP